MDERVYDPNDYNTLEDVSEQFFVKKYPYLLFILF